MTRASRIIDEGRDLCLCPLVTTMRTMQRQQPRRKGRSWTQFPIYPVCPQRDTRFSSRRAGSLRDVMRPAGIVLDRMPDPADVIADGSPLWDVFDQYRHLGVNQLAELDGFDQTELTLLSTLVTEEMGWGDGGLAVSLSVSGFIRAFAPTHRRRRTDRALHRSWQHHHQLLGRHRTQSRQRLTQLHRGLVPQPRRQGGLHRQARRRRLRDQRQ